MMDIIVNGRTEQTDADSLETFVRERDLNPAALVVEFNGSVVPAGRWAATALHAGDRLELLSFVGGG